ncbi:TRAP transporter solute receptor [Desulfocucumis palustris]|uniref:TRAP transporter solute receptor n=1 Tax=Desulfocucumis palustris TaxID=1898651 RepID=A0A2L2XF36_9FIRM|nr:TAXI family TRAP transporter solute-binding subunit [Desulfocucumis palustris]GBF34742.1 TRAP transporter solute receptor [Desulfocucumis palustris]
MFSARKFNLCAVALLIALLSLILVAAGCGGSGGQGGSGEQGGAAKVERISVATGGTGGTYYPYGGGMVGIINSKAENVEATAEVTGASVENARLLDSGEAQMGLLMNDVVYQAYKGENQFDKPIELRTFMGMYANIMHVVTLADGSAKSIADIKGKKVSVGAPGSGTENMSNQIFESLGIKYDDFQVMRLSFSENTEALRDHVIDVGVWSVGAPTSSIMDLATTHKIRILPFTDQEMAKITEKYPYYNATVIPAGTYSGIDQDVHTPAVWNSVVVHKSMSEELAYKLAKALFENNADLVAVYAGAKESTPENTIASAVVPLHPGVIKYFKEKGIDVPDNLVPPEMK